MSTKEPANYHLECLECGMAITDRYTNICPRGHRSLLRTVYKRKRIRQLAGNGIFRYRDWLPVDEALSITASPVTYKSEQFGKELGLHNLYIGFSGYWPDKAVGMKTCTFKELEAAPTFLRAKAKCGKILVVPSAGNTSRAFAEVSAMTGMPVVTIVPQSCVHRMWTTTEPENHRRIFLITVNGDYSDAIALSKELVKLEGLMEEGGVKNVARRDGMGVVELESAFIMRELPEFYFQAVGSGTGAIAAWETFSRLIGDGRFGQKMPRIVVVQNLPFAPMFYAWQDGRAEIIADKDMINAREAIKRMYADVLSTRNPPYSIKGGVYDMLVSTNGHVYGITNEECMIAEKLFESEEGIDIDPAASVSVAALIKAVDEGLVKRGDKILLNITGGGYKRLEADYKRYRIETQIELKSSALLSQDDELKLMDFVRRGSI
ncbi:MAG: cysteate synthase [Halobacteriota archaeon]